MIGNNIYLRSDSIAIYDVEENNLQLLGEIADYMGCVTHVTEDGTYFRVVVIGTEKKLYDFMQCVFYGLRGMLW